MTEWIINWIIDGYEMNKNCQMNENLSQWMNNGPQCIHEPTLYGDFNVQNNIPYMIEIFSNTKHVSDYLYINISKIPKLDPMQYIEIIM
jgi:hypothetical protein